MTEYFPFIPSPTEAFTFSPVLGGQNCTIIVSWNLFGQRWYINVFDEANDLVLCRSLVASPDDRDVNMTSGYFDDTKLVFRESTQTFEVSP